MDEGVMIDDFCAVYEDADLEPMALLRSDALGEGAAEMEWNIDPGLPDEIADPDAERGEDWVDRLTGLDGMLLERLEWITDVTGAEEGAADFDENAYCQNHLKEMGYRDAYRR
jgi:hypothetical protein